MRNTWLYHKLLRDNRPKPEYYASERGKRQMHVLLCILVCFLAVFYLLAIYTGRLFKSFFNWLVKDA